MTSVLTRSFDNARTGANLAETILTPEAVGTRGIERLFSLEMPGDKRGSEGAALIVPGVTMADGRTHDLVLQADMADQVWCWDADTGELLWQQTVGLPVANNQALDLYMINGSWGILSTPVIDAAAGLIYVVALTSTDGTIGTAAFQLIGLKLHDGSQAHPPVNLEQATYQPPAGLALQKFQSVARKQRCGLLLTSVAGVKTVFIGAGSFNEDMNNLGWVIAVDVTTIPAIAAAWATCPRYGGGGVWQGGQGLAADAAGFVYGMTGNGAYDGVTDFGECFFKLGYQPAKGGAAAVLTCVDWFAPFTDTGRAGGDPTLADLSLLPSQPDPDNNPSNMNSATDMDLGSGGPLLLEASLTGFAKSMLIGAGKDGIAYVMDTAKMGKPALADFAPAKMTAGVYAKLLAPPIWFTRYPGNGVDAAPTDTETLDPLFQGKTAHQHSTPLGYVSAKHGVMAFTWGENGNLRAWSLSEAGVLTYLACGAEVASADCGPPGGMPGGMITLSANGDAGGIVWACIPYGDANKTITGGRFLAYDAENFGTFADGSGQLRVLWDSQDWGLAYSHNKFNVPVAGGGKVFVPTYDGRVDVYGPAGG